RCRRWWRFRLRVRLALGPFVGRKAESDCRPPAEQFCSNALALSEYVLELHFRCIDRLTTAAQFCFCAIPVIHVAALLAAALDVQLISPLANFVFAHARIDT